MDKDTMNLTTWAAHQAALKREEIKHYISEGIPLEKSLEMALRDSILSKRIKGEIIKELIHIERDKKSEPVTTMIDIFYDCVFSINELREFRKDIANILPKTPNPNHRQVFINIVEGINVEISNRINRDAGKDGITCQ